MKIDNSMAGTFAFCPSKFQEAYVSRWKRNTNVDNLSFGTRIHELLAGHFGRPPANGLKPINECLADEAEEMFEAYKGHYPVEEFEVIDVERYFEVPLPDSPHILVGVMDVVCHDSSFHIMDHKSEERGSKANLPDVWAAKPQVSLYQWAAKQIYRETFDSIYLDVLTRRSPAGRIPCTFRRDSLQRSSTQQAQAVRDITWIADRIQQCLDEYGPDQPWPRFNDNCNRGGWRCDYYNPHVIGETMVKDLEELVRIREFIPAEDYWKK